MNSEDNTIFHRIIRKEIPATIVYEDEHAIAFRDIQAQSPTHILLVPKKTIPSLREVTSEDSSLLGHLLLLCSRLAEEEGIDESGYRVVINAGKEAGQTVFQLHLHLLGGRTFNWPPG